MPDPDLPMFELPRACRLDGRNYLYFAIAAIREARSHIYVSQFIADADPRHDPDREVRFLCHLLGEARWRGLDVRVLLNDFHSDDGYEGNYPAALFLSELGVPTRWFVGWEGSRRKTSHSKFIVIDKRLVVVGSHNWTRNALVASDESAFALESSHLAARLAGTFISGWERTSDNVEQL